MPSMSKKQRLSVMGLLVVLLSAALVFTYGGIPYSDLPLPGNITAQERELKRLRGTVKKLRRAHRRRDRQMEDLRRLAAPFWVLDTQGAAADVVAELRKLTRDAQVTPQSVRLSRDKPEKYTEYVQSVEITVQITDTMKNISRFLKTLEESDRAFFWKTCTIRPDNANDPKKAVFNGRIQALLLSPEATALVEGGGLGG